MTSESLRFHLILDSAAHTGEPPNTVSFAPDFVTEGSGQDARSTCGAGILLAAITSIPVAGLSKLTVLGEPPVPLLPRPCGRTCGRPEAESPYLRQAVRLTDAVLRLSLPT